LVCQALLTLNLKVPSPKLILNGKSNSIHLK
jgi:hypothetical protein